MLIPQRLHDDILSGRVTVAFRNWKRPTVKAGGTLTTAIGVLGIDAVDVITADEITTADARAAGFNSVEEVVDALRDGDDRQLHRIRFHWSHEDPRIALRNDDDLSDQDRASLTARLQRWDAASTDGPWTRAALQGIRDHPELLAADLAELLGSTKQVFKPRVRKLKSLGLTESMPVGYRLSPRGRAFLDG